MATVNTFYSSFDEETLEPRGSDSYRTVFEVDRDRVVHSYAFRRLQAKTQVFKPGEYDFYRTRLTHTIEVSQIGRSICAFLRKTSDSLSEDFFIDPDLVEAVCLAHDIGHPPFGHAWENLLNRLMTDFGGFEANAQTLRILTETVWPGPSSGLRQGMSPTRALLDGILKYKKVRTRRNEENHFIYKEQRKYLDFVHRRLPAKCLREASIECQIMDFADDVAYSVGDLVDGVYARFITEQKLTKWESEKESDSLVARLLDAVRRGEITRFAAGQIGEFVRCCRLTKKGRASSTNHRYQFDLNVPPEKRAEQKRLKQISFDLVFASPAVQQLEYKALAMLEQLFTILRDNYIREGLPRHRLLNEDVEKTIQSGKTLPQKARLLCDYISGMSDDYVVRTCRRLTDPEFGSIVDLV